WHWPRGAEDQIGSSGGADPGRKDAKLLGLAPQREDFIALRIEINGDKIAALILTKILQDRVLAVEVSNGRADTGCHSHLPECHRKAAIGKVVNGRRNAVADQLA